MPCFLWCQLHPQHQPRRSQMRHLILEAETLRQNTSFHPLTRVLSDWWLLLLLWLTSPAFDSTSFPQWRWKMGVLLRGKMQSRCQTSVWLTTYRGCLCSRARPCHLTFPLSPIPQTLLATRYRFFILLNIPLPLIEFTPDYQCLKEASPPLTALPGCSHPRRGHTRSSPSIRSSCG